MSPPASVTPTTGFQINSVTPGDRSALLQWQYGSSITESQIIKLMVFMNDITVSVPSETNNLSWSASEVDFSKVSLKNTTINSLVAGEQMVFYLAAVTRDVSGNIHTYYSELSEQVTIISAPSAFVLPDIDGRHLDIEGSYNLSVQFTSDIFTGSVSGSVKVIIMLLSNDVSMGNLVYEFSSYASYDVNTHIGIFVISGLHWDRYYEVSGFVIVDGLPSPMSNTRLLSTTTKTSPPTKPDISLNYSDGTVTLSTSITEPGIRDLTYLELYDSSGNLLSTPVDITSGLYGNDLQRIFSTYVYDASYNSNTFTYATRYQVRYRTDVSDFSHGKSDISANCLSDVFYLLRTPEPPTNFNTTPGDRQVALSWSNGDLYGSNVYSYILSYNLSGMSNVTTVELFSGSFTINNNVISLNNPISDLINGQTYDFRIRVKVSDLNNTGQFIYSDYTDDQQSMPYTTGGGGGGGNDDTLDTYFTVSYDISNVNTQVVLRWNLNGYDTGGLTIIGYTIQRGTDICFNNPVTYDLSNNFINYGNFTDTSLTNGQRYYYRIRMVTYNAVNDIIVNDSYWTNYRTIVPWSLPVPPSVRLSLDTSYLNIGNRYVRFDIVDGVVPSTNGISLGVNLNRYKIYVDGNYIEDINYQNDTGATYKLSNLTNDVSYNITVESVYLDPNIESTYHTTDKSIGVDMVPKFVSNQFSVSSIIITDISDSRATATWTPPTRLNDLSYYDLSLCYYKVSVITATSLVSYDVSANVLTYNFTDLSNGKFHMVYVEAIYDSNLSTSGIQQVSSREQSITFYPFTTYPISSFSIRNNFSPTNTTFDWSDNSVSLNNNTSYVNVDESYKIYYRIPGDTGYGTAIGPVTTKALSTSLLTDGQTYEVRVQTNFRNPNNGQAIYVHNDWYTFTKWSIPNALYLYRRGLDYENATLSWSSANMSGIPFIYQLTQIDLSNNNYETVYDVSSNLTSYSVSLETGHTYNYYVNVRFTDPNLLFGTSDNHYVYNTQSNIVLVDPYSVPSIGTLNGNASDTTVSLNLTDVSNDMIDGLPILSYRYGYKVHADANYTYVDTSNSTVTITNLTNGQQYDFVYLLVVDNSNNDISNSMFSNDVSMSAVIVSRPSSTVTLIPFANPLPPTNLTRDILPGSDIVLSWTIPVNPGVLGNYTYGVYEEDVSGNYTLVGTANSYTYTVNKSSTNYGQTFRYKIRTITDDINDTGNLQVYSLYTSSVSKILFEAPKAVTTGSVSYNNQTLNFRFTSNYTTSVGLLFPKLVYRYWSFLVDPSFNPVTVYADAPSTNSDEIISEFIPRDPNHVLLGIECNGSIAVTGVNPNDISDILLSNSYTTNMTFNAYAQPVLNEFYVTEVGDRYISLAINAGGQSLKLYNTSFYRYRLEFYRGESLVGTNYYQDTSYNNLRIEQFQFWPDVSDHGVLINDISYTLHIYVDTLLLHSENLSINDRIVSSGSPVIISSVTPSILAVPVVTAVIPNDNGASVQLNVDTKGLDVLDLILLVVPNYALTESEAIHSNAILLYDLSSSDIIPVLITATSTTLNITLSDIDTTQILSYMAIVKTRNGWSDPFFKNYTENNTNYFIYSQQ